MNTTPKHGLTNRLIAMLLVLTMTCVYVVGDNYAPIIADQSKPKSTDLLLLYQLTLESLLYLIHDNVDFTPF